MMVLRNVGFGTADINGYPAAKLKATRPIIFPLQLDMILTMQQG
jgi:hypothetical protein